MLLFELGADVHVALPNYRRLFCIDARKLASNALRKYKTHNGLLWAFDQAMQFHRLPKKVKARTVARIMTEAAGQFNHAVTAERYFELYERMLSRPLVAGHQ